MEIMLEMRYLKNVVTLELDVEKCIGCGMCATVCPHAVFAIENKKARMVDRDACMECGACELNCPVKAIDVEAGVGCATGIMSSALQALGVSSECCECDPNARKTSEPCCSPEETEDSDTDSDSDTEMNENFVIKIRK